MMGTWEWVVHVSLIRLGGPRGIGLFDSFCEKSHVPYLTIRDLGIAVPSLVWSFYLHYMKFTGVSYFNNEGMAAE